MLQLFFAYSLSLSTIIVVVSTSIYQIVIFFVAFGPDLGWVSRLYVPYFLRVWPLRQYFLFILDSIALMTTRNRKIDLVRLAAGPLTVFVCMVFTASGIFRIDQTFQGYPVNFAVSVYFIVVTVTTVGFGDVTAKTKDGYAIVMVIIFIFISKMPTFITVIRSTAKILKAFRSYKGRKNHFIVYGLVTREEAISILDEVFCLYPMKSVCFCNKEFDPDVSSIGRHPTYRLRCTFLLIDNLDAFSLKRMQASEAAGVIIFPIREGYSSRVDDDVMLSSLIFERFLPDLSQYVWLRYGLHVKLLKGLRASVTDEHVKKNIMATSLLLPGVIPFLVNLVRTAWAQGEEPENLWTADGMRDWRSHYEYSRRNVLSSCVIPDKFVGTTLREVVSQFKRFDVLIVAVEEYARQVMSLDLNYVINEGDVLMAIYERNRNRLAEALQTFSLNVTVDGDKAAYGENYCKNVGVDDLLRRDMNSSFLFYPYSSAHDVSTMAVDLTDEARSKLMSYPFVPSHVNDVPVEDIRFDERSAHKMADLIKRYEYAVNDAFTSTEEKFSLATSVEGMILSLLSEVTNEQVNVLSDERSERDNPDSEEVFLFIDQTTSILRKTSVSIYEDVISQTIAQYELYVMFQCIRSVHANSKLSLLTLRKYAPEFLTTWQSIFNSPIRYIRGQGSLDAHVSYALGAEGRASKVRGILLYCSQMGPRDFGDVPIFP
ncbi:calcium/potassium channel (CAKC) [Angomonas deanei]|nr:calcium/potassium channel (CAKC) [Angomonas deanei]|eukprot:EPY31442.1 calcium/potassium channel (CAKC) [Angomonas deanei]